MWSTPRHGVGTDLTSANVCGSRKSSRAVAFGDHDRVGPVGREVHVVRDRRPGSCASGLPVSGSIGGQRVPGVVRDVQVLEVVRRDDVLRQPTDREVIDDLVGRRIDHVDRVRLRIRHVDPRPRCARPGQVVCAVGGVDIVPVDQLRYGGDCFPAMGHSSEIPPRVPEAPRPPASRIRAPASRRPRDRPGEARAPAAGNAAQRSGPRLDRGRSACRSSPPAHRSRTRLPPSAAAAACVVGLGSHPMMRDPSGRRVKGQNSGAGCSLWCRASGNHDPAPDCCDGGVAQRHRGSARPLGPGGPGAGSMSI